MKKYEVIDRQTNKRVGQLLSTRKTASRKVDKLDNDYGACRYFYKILEVTT